MGRTINAGVAESVKANSSVNAAYRINFTYPYLLGAARFSRLVGQSELVNSSGGWGDWFEEMSDNALACVFFADAAIESFINEVFADAKDLFPPTTSQELKKNWKTVERKSTKNKMNLALDYLGKEKLDPVAITVQAFDALSLLRNKLTHYNPEWSNQAERHLEHSEELARWFRPNPVLAGENLFPRAWVGHSCTSWAVKTAIDFIKEFERRSDLSRVYLNGLEKRLCP